MEDIFEQVDEQLDAERAEKFWRENRKRIIAALVIFFIGLFAYVGWREYRQSQDRAASDLFMAADLLLGQGDVPGGRKALEPLLRDYSDHGYGLLARLLDARTLAESGQTDAAVAQLRMVAREAGSSPLAGVAWMNAAYLTANDPQQARELLKNIGADSPFRALALELLGLMAAKNGDEQAALEHYRQAMALNPEGSLQMRLKQRLERMGEPGTP